MKTLRFQRTKKKELQEFILKKITELIIGIDNQRTFINERLLFDECIGLSTEDIKNNDEQMNNITVEMDMNEAGRLKRMVIDMEFEYDEIRGN